MKEVPPSLKSWIEFLEKLLIVIGLLAGGVAGGHKVLLYLGAKGDAAQAKVAQEHAKATQEQETANALGLLTRTYSDLLKGVDEDIRKLDTKLEQEVFTSTVGWDKLQAIRNQKVTDRNEILKNLGAQMVQFKSAETKAANQASEVTARKFAEPQR